MVGPPILVVRIEPPFVTAADGPDGPDLHSSVDPPCANSLHVGVGSDTTDRACPGTTQGSDDKPVLDSWIEREHQ